MRFLRTNTAVIITVGPFYDKTDGVTIKTALTITNERITLTADTDDNAAPTNILDNVTGATSGTSNDLNYITGNDAGMMQMELSAANTNRLGRMFLSITDAANHVPVFHEFMVLPAMIYDAFVAGTDVLDSSMTQILGTAVSTPATAGILDINLKNIANAAVSTSTAQLGVNAVNHGGTAQTGRDIGASVLLSAGTGTGQLDFTSGVVKANLAQILGTALTETAGLIAAGFKKFFNVASPTGTVNSLADAVPGAAGGGFIAGTNAATTVTTALTTTFTGNLTGSVASVTGAVASVTGAVGSIASGGIAAASIAADAITAAKIADGAIDAATFAAGAIDATAIAADAITAAKIADGAIDAATFAASAITATAIASNAITAAKIADGAIDAATFAAGAIDATAIAADAITAAKIADGAIDAATFASGAITATAIAANAIGASELAADAVAEIADAVWDEVLSDHLTSGTTGAALNGAGAAGDPWGTALPGAYGAGTAGKIIGDNVNATISSRSTLTAAQANTEADTALSDVGLTGTVTGRIDAAVSTRATPAQVNTEVLDCLVTDTHAEVSAVPAATSSLKDKLNWLFALARNKLTQSATTQTLRNDADNASIATAAVSDDSTTATRAEWS